MTTATESVAVRDRIKLYPFDWLVVGYCLLMTVLVAAIGRPIGEYVGEILFYASMAAIAALIIRFVDEDGGKFRKFVRLLYPAMMFTFFYRATGGTMFLVFDSFYDWQLTAFEKAIFGVFPTVFIDHNLLNVWVNELLSFCYAAYYPMIPIFLLILFFRRDWEVIKSFLTAACLTFFVSYMLFFLYPVEGPRWHFAAEYLNGIDGPVFRRLTEFVIDKGAVRGGCMPSSHFGVALVIWMYTFRYYRKWGWPLLPLIFGLAVGTVWGRFHYVSDVVVGGLIGLISVLLVWKYYNISPAGGYKGLITKEFTTENVS